MGFSFSSACRSALRRLEPIPHPIIPPQPRIITKKTTAKKTIEIRLFQSIGGLSFDLQKSFGAIQRLQVLVWSGGHTRIAFQALQLEMNSTHDANMLPGTGTLP
jgi:hypothetical protein